MAFFVGQKVVALASWPEKYTGTKWNLPVKGNIYTIRSISLPTQFQIKLYYYDGSDCLRLVELPNPLDVGGEEPAFTCKHFRPLVEKKTDISIFEKMLNTNYKKVKILEHIGDEK